MRVLVTGAAGYIGDSAVSWLLENGHNVIAMDSFMYGGSYMRQHPRLRFVRGDVRDLGLMVSLINNSCCDAVVHLAAVVGDGACAANPELTMEVNQKAVQSIANICRTYNKRLVFASTCSVYGNNNDLLDEQSPTNPLSLYAGTKLKAEEFVREVPQHYIFRLGTLFGLSTPHARLRCDLVANILTYKAMQGNKLTVYGGEQWRPLLHVKDAGQTMAMASVQSTHRCGTYILSHKNYKIVDLAQTIIDTCRRGSMEVTEMPFEDQRNYKVSLDRAGAVWPTDRSLPGGILEMAAAVHEGRIADVWNVAHHNARFAKEVFNV